MKETNKINDQIFTLFHKNVNRNDVTDFLIDCIIQFWSVDDFDTKLSSSCDFA